MARLGCELTAVGGAGEIENRMNSRRWQGLDRAEVIRYGEGRWSEEGEVEQWRRGDSLVELLKSLPGTRADGALETSTREQRGVG